MVSFAQLLERLVFRYGTRALAIGYFLYGLHICLAGPDRYLGPGLHAARLIPGWPYTEGVLLMLVSAAPIVGLLTHRRRLIAYGLTGLSLWLAGMAVLGVLSIIQDAGAGVGAFWSNFVPSIAIAIRSIAYFLRDPEEGRA